MTSSASVAPASRETSIPATLDAPAITTAIPGTSAPDTLTPVALTPASAITYRPLALGDADDLADILGDVWHADVQGEVRHLHGLIDLAMYAQQPTWTQVAQMDGRAVGLIAARVGEPEGDAAAAAAAWKQVEEGAWERLRALPNNKADELADMFAHMAAIDAELLQESGCNPRYELVVFAVSAATQGRGVGGTLLRAAQDYLRQQGATRAFFYTDTACNWQYYEHRGMKRMTERALEADGAENQSAPGMMSERMFVYQMDL